MLYTSTKSAIDKDRLEQSRSQRILWLLEELKLPYEIEIHHRDPVTHFAPPELKKVHPLGKSPVITVAAPGATEPVVIAESAFIVEYLLDHFSNGSTLLPKRYNEGQEGKAGCETQEWLRFRYFLHYAEGSLMTFMLVALIAIRMSFSLLSHSLLNLLTLEIKTSAPFFIRPITNAIAGKIQSSFLEPNFATHYGFLEGQLETSGGNYLCGPHLTGADIMLSFPLIAGGKRTGLSKEKFPKLAAYVERLENEPGYKKAADKIIELDGKFEATL
jgi:glutathione S-transferase